MSHVKLAAARAAAQAYQELQLEAARRAAADASPLPSRPPLGAPAAVLLLQELSTQLPLLDAPPALVEALRTIGKCLERTTTDAATSHLRARVARLEQLQARTRALSAEVARNEGQAAGRAPEIAVARARCERILAQVAEASIGCDGIRDDCLLLQAEAEHGTLEPQVDALQTRVSDTHNLIAALKAGNTQLLEETDERSHTVKLVEGRRERLGSSRVPRSSLTAVTMRLRELQSKRDLLQRAHDERRDEVFRLGVEQHAVRTKLAETQAQVGVLARRSKQIRGSHSPRPNWDVLGSRIGDVRMRKFVRCDSTGALQHPFARDNNNDAGRRQMLPTETNISALTDLVTSTQWPTFVQTSKERRVRDLFAQCDKLHSALLQRTREALPAHFHYESKVQAWTRNSFKRLDSLGPLPDVPLFLRAPKSALFERRAMRWTHAGTRQVITDLRERKRQLSTPMSMPGFLYMYSQVQAKREQGVKGGGPGWATGFCWALRHWSLHGDAVCHALDLVVHQHWHEAYFVKIDELHRPLLQAFERLQQDAGLDDGGNTLTLPPEEFERILRRCFPLKTDNQIGYLLDAARRDTVFLRERGFDDGLPGSDPTRLLTMHLFALGHRELDAAAEDQAVLDAEVAQEETTHEVAHHVHGDDEEKLEEQSRRFSSSYGIYGDALGVRLNEQCKIIWPGTHQHTHHHSHPDHTPDEHHRHHKHHHQHKHQKHHPQHEKHEGGARGADADGKDEVEGTRKPAEAASSHGHLEEHKLHLRDLGFLAVLQHQFLCDVKHFHSNLKKVLGQYAFTGSGRVLAHYVIPAICAAQPHLNMAQADAFFEQIRRKIKAFYVATKGGLESAAEKDMIDVQLFVRMCRQSCLCIPNGEFKVF